MRTNRKSRDKEVGRKVLYINVRLPSFSAIIKGQVVPPYLVIIGEKCALAEHQRKTSVGSSISLNFIMAL
jgi:hypothetical protein